MYTRRVTCHIFYVAWEAGVFVPASWMRNMVNKMVPRW